MEAKSARAVRSELQLLSQAFFDDAPEVSVEHHSMAHPYLDRVSQCPSPVPSSAPVEPHLTKQECAGALLPESRETAPKMSHSVVVELPLKGEEQKAMLFRADLRFFVCGFKVNAGAYEGAWSVVAAWTAPNQMPLAS